MLFLIKSLLPALLFSALLSSTWCMPLALPGDFVERSLEPRFVFPTISLPTASTVWKMGDSANVVWDPTGVPDGTMAIIQLSYFASEFDERRVWKLAKSVPLTAGKVLLRVPQLEPRSDYLLTLSSGDSYSRSSAFTITA